MGLLISEIREILLNLHRKVQSVQWSCFCGFDRKQA